MVAGDVKEAVSREIATIGTTMMTDCPKCGARADHAVWPFLKGTLDYGEKLVWWRCSACHALFSDLTRLHCPGATDGQHENRLDGG